MILYSPKFSIFMKIVYHTLENFGGGKLANLVNHELFAKNFLTNIHRCTNNVFGICSLFPFLAITFTFMVCQKFPPPKFSCVRQYSLHKSGS